MKQVYKYQAGKNITLKLPGFRTQEQVNQINSRERQLAKHHFSSIPKSEGIWDGVKHLARGIQHGYNAYISPATTAQTGIAPSASIAKGVNAVKSLTNLGKAAKTSLSNDVKIISVPRSRVPAGARITYFKNADGSRTPKYFSKSQNSWIEVTDDIDNDVQIVRQSTSKPVRSYNNDVQIVGQSTPKTTPVANYDDDVQILQNVQPYDYNNDIMMLNNNWDDSFNFGLDIFKEGGKL